MKSWNRCAMPGSTPRTCASQKALAEQIQLQGLEILPYIPLGQIFQPTAFRSDIKDIVKAMFPLFWGVHRG